MHKAESSSANHHIMTVTAPFLFFNTLDPTIFLKCVINSSFCWTAVLLWIAAREVDDNLHYTARSRVFEW